MDLGSQISNKFKASIKQKLKDCGTYIDDELPEYIMVMIANRRQEHQMKEDLSLFLGDETDNFVTWLFQSLTKLQNVAQDKIEEIKLEGMKSDENSEKSKGEKWKLTNTIASKRSLDSVQLVTNTVKNEAMGNEIISFKKDDAIEYETEFSNVKKKMSISEDRKRKIEDSQSTKDSSSDLSEIYSSKRRRSSSSTSKADAKSEQQEIEQNAPEQIHSVISVQKIRPSLPRPHHPPGTLVMKAIKEANQSVATRPNRGSDQIEIEATNVDDISQRKIQINRGRSKLYEKAIESIQENALKERKNDEVEANEIEAKKRNFIGEQERPQEDGIEVEVANNEFNDEDADGKIRTNKRIVISHGHEDDLDKTEFDENRRSSDVERIKFVDERRRNDGIYERKEESYEEKDEDRNRSHRRRKKHRSEKLYRREKRRSSPKFIVTLHGGLDERVKEEKEQRISRDPLFINLNPKGPMAILESAQNEINKMAHQLDLLQGKMPTSDPLTSMISTQPTVPFKTGMGASITRPVFQDTLSLLSTNSTLNDEHLKQYKALPHQNGIMGLLPVQSPVGLLQTAANVKNGLHESTTSRKIIAPLGNQANVGNYEDEGTMESEFEIVADKQTGQERCRFWPNCKNTSCVYVHPSKPCRMFPNCSFKEKCLYIHPMCKFDKRCMNSDCAYMHSSKFRNGQSFGPNVSSSPIPNDMATPLCKFIPNCKKTNCPFRHPISKPCRYGSGCKRPNCQFHHETKPATGDALKWTSTSCNANKHISERTFAATDDDVTALPVSVKTDIKT